MDQYILTTILKNTYSQSQLKHRLNILKSNLLKTFFSGLQGGSEPESLSLSKEDLSWLKSLPSDFYQKFNKDNVYQIFAGLEGQINKVAVLTIYLTFEPDEVSLMQIGDYARKTFANPTLLLDIKYDPRLIAGAALTWKGVYKDYSLKARINERKLVILDSFKKFLR